MFEYQNHWVKIKVIDKKLVISLSEHHFHFLVLIYANNKVKVINYVKVI